MEDGWIEWNGGECPVAEQSRVQVKFRAGGTRTRKAANTAWDHRPDFGRALDVIAYRVVPA